MAMCLGFLNFARENVFPRRDCLWNSARMVAIFVIDEVEKGRVLQAHGGEDSLRSANRGRGMGMGHEHGHDLLAVCVHGTMKRKARAAARNQRSASIDKAHAEPKLLKT